MSGWAAIAMILGSASGASAETLKTSSMAVEVEDGVVTSLTDLRTGQTWRAAVDPVTGLRRLKGRHLWSDKATTRTERLGQTVSIASSWREDGGESRLVTQMSPQSDGDVIITQRARSAAPGLVGVQWGLVVPESWDVLVPGHSGLRFGKETMCSVHEFHYPRSWESQFVLIQGKRGGVLVHAEDDAGRFKVLHLDRKDGRFVVAFETRCTAPFESITEADSVRWRLHAYQGDWLVGAGRYRVWAAKAFGLKPVPDRRPAWIKDVQFVVIAGLQQELLDALARQVEPRQTLIYVPSWRRDRYDRNYPDYTPADGFAGRVQRARAMGFRVMLHVNYFGVTPENAYYKRVEPYHCRDPFSGKRLYWDWQRANPPIKFAYINPAAKAWRDLFVRLMVELCERVKPDALHLDQTLCIYNDMNGPIDGLNMMQGNLAIHRELREALPDVALSGEGLNEVTCRYEAFAQRHVYGINHADQDWNNGLIAQAHPVSSALLAPYTTIYGYLGMANPQPEDYYFAWRTAYERFGVIPTLSHPSRTQVLQPPPVVRVLLSEARWFQQNRPMPDLAPTWGRGTLFAYKTVDGRRAGYRRDDCGTALTDAGPPRRVISRRLTGVTTARLPGTIPGWRAYDKERLLGLDPAASYVYLDDARDPRAFHICALPASIVVRRVSLRRELAALCLDDERMTVAELWRYDGVARCGQHLRDGTVQQVEGRTFAAESGATIHPDGQAIFAHPPWKADRIKKASKSKIPGLGVAWTEFDVRLPADNPAQFEAGVGLRTEHAAEQSDGVTFRVKVRTSGGQTDVLSVERHTKSSVPEPLTLDMSSLRGQTVTVRLETDPGPAGSVTFDWALWTRPRIVLCEPYTAEIELVSPRAIVDVVSGGARPRLDHRADDRYSLCMQTPGTAYLLFERPTRGEPGADLSKLPFGQALVLSSGQEEAPHGFMHARVQEVTCGGVAKRGIFAHPPSRGQMQIDYVLELPKAPIRLRGFAGIRNGPNCMSKGVGFRVAVNGRPLWKRDLTPSGEWVAVDVALAPYAGRPIVLSLITDALGDYICDWAQWAELRLLSEK